MCIAPAPRVTVRFSHADPFNTNHPVSTFQGRLTPFLLIRPNTTPRSPRNFGLVVGKSANEKCQASANPSLLVRAGECQPLPGRCQRLGARRVPTASANFGKRTTAPRGQARGGR